MNPPGVFANQLRPLNSSPNEAQPPSPVSRELVRLVMLIGGLDRGVKALHDRLVPALTRQLPETPAGEGLFDNIKDQAPVSPMACQLCDVADHVQRLKDQVTGLLHRLEI